MYQNKSLKKINAILLILALLLNVLQPSLLFADKDTTPNLQGTPSSRQDHVANTQENASLSSEDLEAVELFKNKENISDEDLAKILNLISKGYNTNEVLYGYTISKLLNISLEEVLAQSAEENPAKTPAPEKDMGILEIIEKFNKFSEIPNNMQNKLCKFFGADQKLFEACEQSGYTLKESINAAQLMKSYGLTLEQVQKLLKRYEKITDAFRGLEALRDFVEREKLSSEETSVMQNLVLDGYKIDAIQRVHILSEALDLELGKIIKKPDTTIDSDEKKALLIEFTQEERGIIEYLAERYNADIIELVSYIIENKITIETILQKVDAYKKSTAKPRSMEGPKSQTTEAQALLPPGVDTNAKQVAYDKYLNAPFNYRQNNSENINLNSGALNFQVAGLSLPGRNGLDLNIGISYDSSNANLYTADYESGYRPYYYYIVYQKALAYMDVPDFGYYRTDGSEDIPEEEFGAYEKEEDANLVASLIDGSIEEESREDMHYFTDAHENTVSSWGKYNPWELVGKEESSPAPQLKYINQNGYKGYIPRSTTDKLSDTGEVPGPAGADGRTTWERTAVWRANYEGYIIRHYTMVWEYQARAQQVYTDMPYSSNTTHPVTYTEKQNGLGAGWSFNFSSIEIEGDSKYLHLSDGSTYKINITSTLGDSNLEKYSLKDMRLEPDSGSYRNADNIPSAYVLIYKNGTKEFFGSDGRLLCIRDRYNNRISFRHTLINNHPVITKIIDSIDRGIDISYTTTQTGKEVTITAPGSKVIKYVLEAVPGCSGEYVLKKIVDAENRETVFNYNYNNGAFDFFNKSGSGTNNTYANIAEIRYPTGAYSKYTYEKAAGNLGNLGYMEYYRVQAREDVDNLLPYNKETYSYSGNNTGYPTHSNPSILPDTYTYSTTVTDANGTARIHTFNNKHLKKTEQLKENGTALLVSTDYTYYLDRLAQSQVTTTYNKSSNSLIKQYNWTYNDFGDLIAYTDEQRQTTNYEYDPKYHINTKVSKYIDADILQQIEYSVNPLTGNVDAMKQRYFVNGADKSITTTYLYDTYGNMTQEATTKEDGSQAKRNYEYSALYKNAYLTKKTANATDSLGMVQTITESYEYDPLTGEVKKHTDGNNHTIQFNYDKLGRITTVTRPSVVKVGDAAISIQYDDIGNTVILTDEKGHKIKNVYDGLGRLKEEQEMKNGAWVVLKQMQYNNMGQTAWAKDAKGNTTSFEYDIFGRVVKTVNPDQTYQTIEYDNALDRKTVIDEDGNKHHYYYNITGKVAKEVVFPSRTNEAVQYTTQYTYNYAGQLKKVTDANTRATNYTYDDLGRLTAVTNAKLEKTAYEYDNLNNLIQITTANGSITQKQYDELGRLIKETDPLGKIETFFYDGAGNLIKKTDKKGQQSLYTYNINNQLTGETTGAITNSYSYDDAGNLLTAQNSSGTISYEYYENSSLKKETRPDGKYIYYEYDNNGNKEKVTDHFGKITVYGYDDRNRMRTVTIDGTTTTYDYYNNGNRRSITYPGGVKEEYTFDGCNKLIALTNKRANGTIISSYSYDYDGVGNQIRKTDQKGTTTLSYDELNRISTVKEPNGAAVSYSYDKNGNILQKNTVTPISYYTVIDTIQNAYDMGNHLTQTSHTINSTKIGTLTISPSTASVPAGQPIAFTLSGTTESGAALSTEMLNKAVWTSSSSSFSLTPATGRTTTGYFVSDGSGYYLTTIVIDDPRTDNVRVTAAIEGKTAAANVSLKTSPTSAGGGTFVIDGGTALKEEAVKKEKQKESSNDVMTLTATPMAGVTTTLSYDDNGNMVKAVEVSGSSTETTNYTYNAVNQLTEYTSPAGVKTAYAYDAFGLRTAKTTGGTTSGYYYDGDNVIIETVNGAFSARNVLGINQLVRQDSGNVTMYYLYNGHGDVVNLVDSTGVVKSTYDYDIYGKSTSAVENGVSNPVRYAGQYYDGESGMYYLRARYYDPEVMRFVSEDSYRGQAADPLSLNLYTYCVGNPVKYSDIDGHAPAVSNDVIYGCGGPATSLNLGLSPSNQAIIQELKFLYQLWRVKNTVEKVETFVGDLFSGKLNDAIWKLPAFIRGNYIEKVLSWTEYKDWYHIGASDGGYFPVIDFQNGKTVVSLKTINPRSYKGNGATNKILEYLRKLDIPITVNGELAQRVLDIRIPKGTESLFNMNLIMQEATKLKITVKIKEF